MLEESNIPKDVIVHIIQPQLMVSEEEMKEKKKRLTEAIRAPTVNSAFRNIVPNWHSILNAVDGEQVFIKLAPGTPFERRVLIIPDSGAVLVWKKRIPYMFRLSIIKEAHVVGWKTKVNLTTHQVRTYVELEEEYHSIGWYISVWSIYIFLVFPFFVILGVGYLFGAIGYTIGKGIWEICKGIKWGVKKIWSGIKWAGSKLKSLFCGKKSQVDEDAQHVTFHVGADEMI